MTRLNFIKSKDKYFVYNKKSGDLLGVVEYYPKWKKWIWEQSCDIIMDLSENGCMQEVCDFGKVLK